MDGCIDLAYPVFGEQDDANAAGVEEGYKLAHDGIDASEVGSDGGAGRAEALQIVVKMRKIDQIERGGIFLFDPAGGLGNPTRGGVGAAVRSGHAGRGAPKGGEGEFAQVLFYFRADGGRPGIDVED